MSANPDSTLLKKAAELIKSAPLDSDLRLLLIEMIVRIEDDKLETVLNQIQQFTETSQQDTEKLRLALLDLKRNYETKKAELEEKTEHEFTALENEINSEEDSEKINQLQKKIQDI